MKADEKELGFECPICGARYHRSVWSIAHWNEDQVFMCDCGARLTLKGDPSWKRAETEIEVDNPTTKERKHDTCSRSKS